MSRLVAAPPPNRVRSPTDRQFASGCSPRRFGPTQLPSATELWHTPTRTFTVLMWRPHMRTHSRENGNPGLFSFFDSRFRGSEETRNAEMNYIKQMPALFVVLFWFTVISFLSTSSHAQPAL